MQGSQNFFQELGERIISMRSDSTPSYTAVSPKQLHSLTSLDLLWIYTNLNERRKWPTENLFFMLEFTGVRVGWDMLKLGQRVCPKIILERNILLLLVLCFFHY